MVRTGLDVLVSQNFERLKGKRVGLVSNQGAIDCSRKYGFDLFRQAHVEGCFNLVKIFGPQHGLFGHTQDNMVEWEGGVTDPITGAKIVSLYGERREPTAADLSDVDELVIDLPDIGARYYTFIWTTALCMKSCQALEIPVLVLDRPNPIGGVATQGSANVAGFESFVGLHPLPMRHGLTLGEIALMFAGKYYRGVEVQVQRAEGWSRGDFFEETGLPWSPPSPNMPSPATAMVYPGMCLLEGTNLSEGRGTTRPFEIFGAPFIQSEPFAKQLNDLGLPGVYFRRLEFQPTFQKHAGKLCGGAFIHVDDKEAFNPIPIVTSILATCRRVYGDSLTWNKPPYEYEYTKLPIDILTGSEWFRSQIDQGESSVDIAGKMDLEAAKFRSTLDAELLY